MRTIKAGLWRHNVNSSWRRRDGHSDQYGRNPYKFEPPFETMTLTYGTWNWFVYFVWISCAVTVHQIILTKFTQSKLFQMTPEKTLVTSRDSSVLTGDGMPSHSFTHTHELPPGRERDFGNTLTPDVALLAAKWRTSWHHTEVGSLWRGNRCRVVWPKGGRFCAVDRLEESLQQRWIAVKKKFLEMFN